MQISLTKNFFIKNNICKSKNCVGGNSTEGTSVILCTSYAYACFRTLSGRVI